MTIKLKWYRVGITTWVLLDKPPAYEYKPPDGSVKKSASQRRRERYQATHGVVRRNTYKWHVLSKKDKRKLLSRQHSKCFWCGGPNESIDHLIPRSWNLGGIRSTYTNMHTIGNLVPCCLKCNKLKASLLPVEFKRLKGIKF